MRMIVNLGAPLDIDGIRYKHKNDRIQEQNNYVSSFLVDIRDKINEELNTGSGF